jgi:hypothetical protein
MAMSNENGTALILSLFLLMSVMMLGLFGLQAATIETDMVRNQREEAAARALARSGLNLALHWFAYPETSPDPSFFGKQKTDAAGGPSFFDSENRSQFQAAGTFFPETVFGQDLLEGIGRWEGVTVSGPKNPGGLCFVESRAATTAGLTVTTHAELEAIPLPALTAALELGRGDVEPIPLKIHWGDIRVTGPADLGPALEPIPLKNTVGFPEGTPYGETAREDGWLDIWVEEEILRPLPHDCGGCPEPYASLGYSHLHQHRSGLGTGEWNYERLKRFAMRFGKYYWIGPDGLLYKSEPMDPIQAESLEAVLKAAGGGFVFVDTTSRQKPDENALTVLEAIIENAEGIFYINADLILSGEGAGRTIAAQSPPSEGTADTATQQTVTLDGIHLSGALITPGWIRFGGATRVFGGIVAGQGIQGGDPLELWYNADLGRAFYPGLPSVFVRSGTIRFDQ